jgi:uncharacterized repeat protein (TIGR01451 family)
MKTVLRMPGLVTRFGLLATALLLGQQALAVGTDAGTDVTNVASVTYSVNGQSQGAVPSNSADFVVDRIVTFTTVTLDSGAFATTQPGATGVTYYRVTNTSNSPLDFDLVADNLTGTVVNGNTDNADMVTPFEIRLGAPNTDTGGSPPVAATPDFVDALPEDQFIDVYVFSDAPTSVNDGDFANVLLRAIAHDPDDAAGGYNPVPDGILGPILVESANTAGGIENVFNDPGTNDAPNNGQEEDYWGFQHVSADLTITKAAVVDSDPFGSGLAIPGATIEYTITIANNGGADATGIEITDTVDADVNFVTDAYNGGVANIEFVLNGGAATFCNADDASDTDQDGCSISGTTLTLNGSDATSSPAVTPIDVAVGDSLEISFQVFIPDTP